LGNRTICSTQASLDVPESLACCLLSVTSPPIARATLWGQACPGVDVHLCAKTELAGEVLLDEALCQLTPEHIVALGDAYIFRGQLDVSPDLFLDGRLDATQKLKLSLLLLKSTTRLDLAPGDRTGCDSCLFAHALLRLFAGDHFHLGLTFAPATGCSDLLTRL